MIAPWRWLPVFWCTLAVQVPVLAQLPSSPLLQSLTSPEARLQALENTYAANLRVLHGPVLQDYLRDLEILKNQLVAQGNKADATAVDTEIAAVRKAASTNGVFPLASLLPAPSTPAGQALAPEAASTKKPSSRKSGPMLTLQASDALGSTTAPGAAASLGELGWSVQSLAAGTYEVAMVYACPALDAPEEVTVSIAGVQQSHKVVPNRATGSGKNFRILRIGTITLDQDIGASTLTLRTSSPTPHLYIRSVILSRPKSAGPQDSAPPPPPPGLMPTPPGTPLPSPGTRPPPPPPRQSAAPDF